MSLVEAVLGMTLEHYLAFLMAGGLATLLFSYIAGPFLINAGITHTVRGLIYGFVTLVVSFTYEYYAGMKDLFQIHAVTVTVITLWAAMTLFLGVVSVVLWRKFRDRKSLN
ncbi:MAG: hypothetical protein ACJA0B_001984 [Alcanivorax borkumensis]|jgi:hypothetical protein|uniref:hypothetical protein n=1 Tax=Alcanivorax borkumensis TaxID=59754 RepID=UPI003EEA6709